MAVRKGAGYRLVFLINHLERPLEFAIPFAATSPLQPVELPGKVRLGPYGATVLEVREP